MVTHGELFAYTALIVSIINLFYTIIRDIKNKK